MGEQGVTVLAQSCWLWASGRAFKKCELEEKCPISRATHDLLCKEQSGWRNPRESTPNMQVFRQIVSSAERSHWPRERRFQTGLIKREALAEYLCVVLPSKGYFSHVTRETQTDGRLLSAGHHHPSRCCRKTRWCCWWKSSPRTSCEEQIFPAIF